MVLASEIVLKKRFEDDEQFVASKSGEVEETDGIGFPRHVGIPWYC